MAGHFVYRTVSVDDATWTPVTCPIDCDRVSISSKGFKDGDFRTAAGDATTEDYVIGGAPVMAEQSTAGYAVRGSPTYRFDFIPLFRVGDVVGYFKCRTGLDTLVARFQGRRT